MSTGQKPPKLGYSIPEFLEATGLGRTIVYKEINEGRLRLTKVGRRSMIKVKDARAWLDSFDAPAKPRRAASPRG